MALLFNEKSLLVTFNKYKEFHEWVKYETTRLTRIPGKTKIKIKKIICREANDLLLMLKCKNDLMTE